MTITRPLAARFAGSPDGKQEWAGGILTPPLALSPGTRLGHYEIGRVLGAGGMGEVYAARDTKLGREVAIKVLPPRLSQIRDDLERFKREARAVAALNHPNIVTLHSVEEAGDVRFLTMEFVTASR